MINASHAAHGSMRLDETNAMRLLSYLYPFSIASYKKKKLLARSGDLVDRVTSDDLDTVLCLVSLCKHTYNDGWEVNHAK